jgi:hypothetical protein
MVKWTRGYIGIRKLLSYQIYYIDANIEECLPHGMRIGIGLGPHQILCQILTLPPLCPDSSSISRSPLCFTCRLIIKARTNLINVSIQREFQWGCITFGLFSIHRLAMYTCSETDQMYYGLWAFLDNYRCAGKLCCLIPKLFSVSRTRGNSAYTSKTPRSPLWFNAYNCGLYCWLS